MAKSIEMVCVECNKPAYKFEKYTVVKKVRTILDSTTGPSSYGYVTEITESYETTYHEKFCVCHDCARRHGRKVFVINAIISVIIVAATAVLYLVQGTNPLKILLIIVGSIVTVRLLLKYRSRKNPGLHAISPASKYMWAHTDPKDHKYMDITPGWHD